jgi:hypothetical protein
VILQEIREIDASGFRLRSFGLLVGGILTGLGLLLLARHRPHSTWFLVPGVMLILLGWAYPKSLKFIYFAWMTIAVLMGFVVAHVILTGFFFLVVTPVGWFCRLCGKDFLRLSRPAGVESYWIPRRKTESKDSAHYEQQF